MVTTPRRRWFRLAFSLRTLFVLVTLVCVWMGWQVKIVNERRRLISEPHGAIANAWPFDEQSDDANRKKAAEHGPGIFRRWIGDRPYEFIFLRLPNGPRIDLTTATTAQEFEGLREQLNAIGSLYKRAFPEAGVLWPVHHGAIGVDEVDDWITHKVKLLEEPSSP